jgi:hypothetical protein
MVIRPAVLQDYNNVILMGLPYTNDAVPMYRRLRVVSHISYYIFIQGVSR